MFNEVDQLILDSIVVCSYCSGKNISKCQGITTTLAGCSDNREMAFYQHRPAHEHNSNIKSAVYDCYDCQKKFVVYPLSACWCGWRQRFDMAKTHISNWWRENFQNKISNFNCRRCNDRGLIEKQDGSSKYCDCERGLRLKVRGGYWGKLND